MATLPYRQHFKPKKPGFLKKPGFCWMGAEGLEPSRPCSQRIFILLQLSLLPTDSHAGFENWTLPLPSTTR